jgi:hypothetical protein
MRLETWKYKALWDLSNLSKRFRAVEYLAFLPNQYAAVKYRDD